MPRRFGWLEPNTVWILARLGEQHSEELTVVHPFPFSIGRKVGCSLQIPSKTVSGHHADLILRDSRLFVIDRESTNGTYVNGRRLKDASPVDEGDMLQFADFAFRLKRDTHTASPINTVCEDVCDQALALVQFDRLMDKRLVTPHYQPIVRMDNLQPIGFEVLARSRVYGLESSGALFGAAAKLNMEVELSQMLRWEGVREAVQLPQPSELYLNTHPLELARPGLIESMHQLRELAPNLKITLEIHESAITNCRDMNRLRSVLKELQFQLAYDDFGAGQNRLPDLCTVPPDVLKFDMSLIRGIERKEADRVKLVSSLVRISLDMGVIPLAEGIETQSEAELCAEIGFVLAQGFYYGRPAPVTSCHA
jgi:EAL domain-containing protein (putative c-di-GMP-specific phosphodiesterase class I)